MKTKELDIVTMTISNGHLIKIVKNPKEANGYKYLGIYTKKIAKEDKQCQKQT